MSCKENLYCAKFYMQILAQLASRISSYTQYRYKRLIKRKKKPNVIDPTARLYILNRRNNLLYLKNSSILYIVLCKKLLFACNVLFIIVIINQSKSFIVSFKIAVSEKLSEGLLPLQIYHARSLTFTKIMQLIFKLVLVFNYCTCGKSKVRFRIAFLGAAAAKQSISSQT